MLTTAPLIVGFFIILLQIGPFLGHPASANVIESVSKFSYFLTYANPAAAGLGILTLGIVFGSPAKLSRLIPSPLLALIVGTLAAVFFLPNRDLRLIGRYILPKSATLPVVEMWYKVASFYHKLDTSHTGQ